MRREVLSGALLALLSGVVDAQTPAPTLSPRGAISGEVVEAEMLAPLRGATVVLLPASAGLLPPILEAGSSFLSVARSVVTGPLGAYRFTDLPFGDYQLRVQRVGYRPMTIDVQLRASDDARVSVGLTVAPIRLHALTVRAQPKPPYGRMETATAEESASRIGAARLRQRLFLGTDVREVTHPDVMEAVTLGTTDLFRALHRLPGVTTRDEDAAELWTRGSRPEQTRVYFDGLPLFGPLHAFGAFTGISTHAVGAAFLHPGVRSASLGEGGAAILDVRSRAGGSVGDVRGVAELGSAAGLTATAARVALDRQARDGRSGWMLAAGRSLFDLWPINGSYLFSTPAYFADVAGRYDYDLGAGRRFELSGLWVRDSRLDDSTGYSAPRHFRWGNDVGRATLSWPIASLRSRHTIGISRFRAGVDTLGHDPFDSAYVAFAAQQRELPMRSAVLHASWSGEFEPEVRGSERAAWVFGYDLTARRVDFDGDTRHVLLRIESARSERTWETPTASVWATRRWRAGERLVLEPGLRVDVGPPLESTGGLRTMPRLQARFTVDSQTMLSAGLGRFFQYTQAIGRIESGTHAVIYPTPLWLGADDSTPALRTDIGTLGVERWLGGTWLMAANAYHRRSGGHLLPDPTPSLLVDRGLVVQGGERASGLELSARKLGGRVTGSASYTYGVATTTAIGLSFPSSQDRRHSVDLALLARLRPSIQFSAAYTYATGAPFTRLRSVQGPREDYWYPWLPDSLLAAPPNAARKPLFSSLDVALDWSFAIYGVRAAAYVQFRNALMHKNPGIYFANSGCNAACRDAFLENRSSNVLLPTIGLRARF